MKNRIYFASLMTNIGNWLTFLAIALLVKEKHGVHQVAYTFMVQAIIPLLFSQSLVKFIPESKQKKAFFIVQILFALNLGLLLSFKSMGAIYLFLIVSSLLKTLSNPLFQSLIGRWVKTEEQKEVYTRVGAINATCLAIAPLFGGYVSLKFGYDSVFLIDMISFLIPLFVLAPMKALKEASSEVEEFKFSKLFKSIAGVPKGLNLELKKVLFIWFLFLNVGAFINGIEFPIFEKLSLSKDQIGLIIGMWGLGSLLSFLLAKTSFSKKDLFALNSVSLTSGIVAFAFTQNFYILAISFLVLGFSIANLSGEIRAKLQKSVPENTNPLPIWAFSNQIISLSNIICYGLLGLLTNKVDLEYLGGGLALLTMILLFGKIQVEKRFSVLRKA